MSQQIQLRRGTAATWTATNPTLAQGEAGVETDTLKVKIGDGVTAWNALAYFGTGLTDHTHAVTGSGATGGGGTLAPATFDFPSSAAPAQTAEGRAVWDSDDDLLTIGDGASRKTFGPLDATAPSTQALGDAAAAGAANVSARRDHKHAMPSATATASGLLLAATQRLLGRNTAGAGAVEEVTLAQFFNWLLTTRGDLITRDATGAVRKAIGAAHTRLVSDGTDPQWATLAGWQLARSANQAIAANTDTAITFPTETTDTDAFHAANASVVTIPAGMGGWYSIAGFASFSSDGTGARHCWIGKNGAATQLALSSAPSGTTQRGLAVSCVVKLAAGDTVELYVNTVGGTPSVNPAAFTGVFLGA